MKFSTMLLLASSVGLMAQSYFIRGPKEPKSYEATAIKELTDYLAKRIDGKLVIGGKSPVTFMVGDTDLAKEQKCSSTELEDERWVIKSVGDKVILNGGGTRGALYATYHFLEDLCDIHWWSDYEEYVPEASSLTLDRLDLNGKPMFLYRDIYRSHKTPQSVRLAVRVRLNRDGDTSIPLALGGAFTYGRPAHCHTFDRYLPFSKYGQEHPEYYSLINGKRVGGQVTGQLCITNPALRQEFLGRLLEFIEEDKKLAVEKKTSAPRIYEISMNDNWGRCECEACKAEEEKYNPSGVMLNFVNWLAGEVGKKYPGLYLSTLAYFYNEPPPKGGVRAADNVIVKLCDTRTNQAASILEPQNKVYYDFLTSWKDFSKHLFIWDYAIVFTSQTTGLPFASELHYGDLYKTYYENSVSGVFWEHERPHLADFWELKYFVETKLFEDPYQDVSKLISRFMNRYYGAAADILIEYRKELDKVRVANKGYISWFPKVPDYFYIKNDDMIRFQKMFDEAEAAVAGDALRMKRVRHARAGLDRLTCQRQVKLFHQGPESDQKLEYVDSSAAYARLRESWRDWTKDWTNEQKVKDEMDKDFTRELEKFSKGQLKKQAVPPELEGRSFYDIYPSNMDCMNSSTTQVVDDEESPVGCAVRSNVDASDKRYFDLPFEMGVYNSEDRRGVISKKYTKPIGVGYNWYKFDKPVTCPPRGYLYFTRSWTTQFNLSIPECAGKTFDIWASVKFTGPKFFDGSQDKNFIYVDRVVLIEK